MRLNAMNDNGNNNLEKKAHKSSAVSSKVMELEKSNDVTWHSYQSEIQN